MKKREFLTAMILLVMLHLPAGIFSGYDFTYFNSVSPTSLGAFDLQKLGLDMTGYGYLGDMTSGIYLRLGIQTPFTTIFKLFDDGENDAQQQPELVPGTDASTGQMRDAYEFKVLFSLGPAFRRKVSPTLSWYMGLGIMVEQDRKIMQGDPDISLERELITDNTAAFDMDFGFRLSAHEHSVMRIGAYLTRSLFNLTETIIGDGDPEYDFDQYLFIAHGAEKPFELSGYISLGHTYTSGMSTDAYRYRITGPEFGTGTLELM